MAFTHRNTQGNTASGASSIIITKPTGLTVGDLMVATIGKDDDPSVTGPSGWSNEAEASGTAGNDNNGSVWYKVADAADVAASNFTWNGDAGEDYAGIISAFIPGNGNPVHVQSSAVRRSDDATPASNALTTTAGNLMVGGCTANRADTDGLVTLVSSDFTIPTNGQETTGTANGDVSNTLAYDLSAAGGSVTVEFDNVDSAGESVVTISEFSDDVAAGSVMPHLWKFATGV